jgi:Fe2+ or Zn2+ uptake regulation protein
MPHDDVATPVQGPGFFPRAPMDGPHANRARCLIAGQAHSLLGDLLKAGAEFRCDVASVSADGWSVLAIAFPAREGSGDRAPGECDRDCLVLLARARRPLPAWRVRQDLEEAHLIHGIATVKRALARWHRLGLVDLSERPPRGYYLSERLPLLRLTLRPDREPTEPTGVDRLRSLVGGHVQVLLGDLLAARLTPQAEVAFLSDVGWSVCLLAFPTPAGEDEPEWTACERACLRLLEERGKPLPAEAIWSELVLARGCSWSLSTVKRSLTHLMRQRRVANSSKAPRGYYLVERLPVLRLAARA